MPINSNQTFNNKGESYNATMILGENKRVDIDLYKAYGPPYFSGANMFGQGAWYGWYMLSLTYIAIRHWTPLSRAVRGMYLGIRHRTSVYADQTDPHSRMMSKYLEVPDWWYACVLAFCVTFGLIGMLAWPTQCPWWSIFAVLILNIIFLVPSTVIVSYSNLRMDAGLLFQMLAGVWYAGNPQGLIVAQNFGTQFGVQTDNFVSDLKIGHYAKLPPRAVFRGQIFSVILNTFIWIGMSEHFLRFNDLKIESHALTVSSELDGVQLPAWLILQLGQQATHGVRQRARLVLAHCNVRWIRCEKHVQAVSYSALGILCCSSHRNHLGFDSEMGTKPQRALPS